MYEEASAPKDTWSRLRLPSRAARVAVCETEPATRGAIVSALRAEGYDVVETVDSAQLRELLWAVDQSEGRIPAFDLVMLATADPSLLGEVRAACPAARVLLIGGSPGDDRGPVAGAVGRSCSCEELRATVRRFVQPRP